MRNNAKLFLSILGIFAFNLALLAKNINANRVQDKIRIVTNPLTAQNEFADFNLQVTDEGGALSAFGVEYGQDGLPLQKVLSYQTCGFSLDHLMLFHVF